MDFRQQKSKQERSALQLYWNQTMKKMTMMTKMLRYQVCRGGHGWPREEQSECCIAGATVAVRQISKQNQEQQQQQARQVLTEQQEQQQQQEQQIEMQHQHEQQV